MQSIAYFGLVLFPTPQLLLDLLEHARTRVPTIEQSCNLVLGQLSPAIGLGSPDYPQGYDSNELLRCDAVNEADCQIKGGEDALLSDLLDHRVGTPASYAICLGLVLYTSGQRSVEWAVTGQHAEPPQRPFVVCEGQHLDLFARAMNEPFDPARYRVDKRIKVTFPERS